MFTVSMAEKCDTILRRREAYDYYNCDKQHAITVKLKPHQCSDCFLLAFWSEFNSSYDRHVTLPLPPKPEERSFILLEGSRFVEATLKKTVFVQNVMVWV